ncbi:MAG: hybrid sensor histidine kinase/response regulator [Deltaproteobacteria bacterium]|nr:MAG: hybrid sensor histidine kinase/response regulator [Deltaproteobacteria bacterium]
MKKNWLLLLLVSLLGLCAFLFTLFYQEAKREAIHNINVQQSLHARQAARGIEDFFIHWTNTLTVLSESSHIISMDQTGRKNVDSFYKANREQIRGITRVDASGRIVYTIPYDRNLIGRDISFQKHVQEVMRTRKPVISDVFTAVQGYQTVALHIPVFGNRIYRGTIAIAIDVQSLARRYLEAIKIGKTGYAWMTSRDGTELYCPVPGHTGKSVYINCADFPSILAMAGEMLKGHQGVTTYTFDMIGEQEVKTVKKHAVYMPISLGNTFWSIVVASSEDEILASLADFRNRLILVIALFLLGAALFSFYGLKARFIIKEEEKRLKAEATLRESEEKFRKAFYTSPDSVNINRLEDGMYISINPGFTRITGYMEEDIIGKTSIECNIWGNIEDRQRLIAGLRKDGEVTNLEAAFQMRGGDIRYGLMSASVIDLNGVPHILSITRDITDRKQAEEEKKNLEERLQRAEKMEALGQLAGGVAHDLNNVLGVLTGYSELLLGELPEGQRTRGYAEKILQSTEKGAAIIQDLLTLARRGVTVSDVINLNSIVSDFLKTPVFERVKDYHPRVTFLTEYDRNLLNIKGSLVHLEKTLINLVSNAAEAISGKGEVTIRTESRYIDKPLRGYDEVKEGDYAVLTVSDTGTGIPAESIEKIFEPFYTKKRMGRSGTGLGLAIVWGTVKDHNGYIDVQTEVGEGTTFTLYFPVTREGRIAQQQKESIEQYMGKGESALVVDDVAEQRDVAAGLLTRLGYEVHAASSGEEAVEYLKGNRADILVLDMIMAPGMDGLETYQRVLEINPKQKAIIVSGFSETERVRKTQKLGAGAYVKKPYILEKIGVAIRDELHRK